MCLLARTSSSKSAFLFLCFPGFREEPKKCPITGPGISSFRQSVTDTAEPYPAAADHRTAPTGVWCGTQVLWPPPIPVGACPRRGRHCPDKKCPITGPGIFSFRQSVTDTAEPYPAAADHRTAPTGVRCGTQVLWPPPIPVGACPRRGRHCPDKKCPITGPGIFSFRQSVTDTAEPYPAAADHRTAPTGVRCGTQILWPPPIPVGAGLPAKRTALPRQKNTRSQDRASLHSGNRLRILLNRTRLLLTTVLLPQGSGVEHRFCGHRQYLWELAREEAGTALTKKCPITGPGIYLFRQSVTDTAEPYPAAVADHRTADPESLSG
ncbi:hypothetical protein ATI02_0026 [Pseudomonas baetica]|uniref:Uncharacterized protein n=1 Tax=Pseudomonas baetica TaxID=674054 RepID=A0ABX4PT78_9PSED|nr:hypothetical protein ATI02_0026 [Pseudomonas baetica]